MVLICEHHTCDKVVKVKYAKLCSMHRSRKSKGQDMDAPPYFQKGKYKPKPPRRIPQGYLTPQGYRRMYSPKHPNSDKSGYVMQHVIVMSEMLQRPLFKGENVHHKNGVKDDNRPENLELWVTMQPTGQRPEDLVAYANEILRRYA